MVAHACYPTFGRWRQEIQEPKVTLGHLEILRLAWTSREPASNFLFKKKEKRGKERSCQDAVQSVECLPTVYAILVPSPVAYTPRLSFWSHHSGGRSGRIKSSRLSLGAGSPELTLKSHMMAHACNPSLGEVETDVYPGLTDQLAQPTWSIPGQWEMLLNSMLRNDKGTQACPVAPRCTQTIFKCHFQVLRECKCKYWRHTAMGSHHDLCNMTGTEGLHMLDCQCPYAK